MIVQRKRRPTAAYQGQRGFTILEIIMVVVILGVLMSFLVGGIFGQGDKAKSGINKTKMASLQGKINLYRIEYNQLPPSIQSLSQCDAVTGPACAPSASAEDLLDAWGTPFQYALTNSGNGYQLKSLGADKNPGGENVNADVTLDGP